jgi:adhesin transport system outer membrane protein
MDGLGMIARLFKRSLTVGLVVGMTVLSGQAMAADEIILLPDDDDTTGSIVFSGGGRDTVLDEPRVRLLLMTSLWRQQSKISQSQVQETFGEALSIVIGPDDPLDTLPEIVNLTLATHPLTMQQAHERQALDAYTSEAYSKFLPRLNIRGEVGEEWTRDPTTRQFEEDLVQLTRSEAEAALRQTVFDGWESISEFDRRLAEADASAYQYRALAERVSSQVSDVYLNLLRDNDQLALAKNIVEIHQEYVERISARSGSGVGRESDLDQAEARLAASQSNVIERETDLRDSLVRYVSLVGYPPLEVLIRPKPTKDDLPATLNEAIDFAVANHPAIYATQADMEAARQQLRNARSLYWPRIEIEFSQRYGNNLDGVEGWDQDAQLMLFFNYNLYNGHADRAKIQRSAYSIEQARTQREDVIREVSEAVRQAWNGFTATERRMASLERHVESVRKARDAYIEQWQIGDRTLLDVLDAENELYTSQRTLVEARRDYATALYRLRASMGTLVAHFDADMPSEADPSKTYSYMP